MRGTIQRLADRIGVVGRRAARTAAGACLLGAVCGSAAQDLGVKAPPQRRPVLIHSATVHTVSGPVLERGWVTFDAGRITGVGAEPAPRVTDAVEVVDGAGLHLYPGLISPWTQTGLTEISAVRATLDMNETGDITPEVSAAVAVNPDSTLLPVTRANGVLSVGVFPGGGLVPGRGSVLSLDGWTWEEMTVRRDAGMVINWPYMRVVTAWWMDRSEEDQRTEVRRRLDQLEDAMREARAVRDTPEPRTAPADLRWSALARTLPPAGGAGSGGGGGDRPELPVFVSAAEYDQIVAAVEFGARWGLRTVIVGGRDAPLCAELLRRHDVAVIASAPLAMPRRDDAPYDEPFTLGPRLEGAGLRWCLSSGEETAHERNLPYAAGMAVAHGLDRARALRAITLSAAEILGVEAELGSLEPGKRATLFLADGDVLEVTTNVRHAFIDGKRIDLSSKQSELAEKYREKYRQRERR